MVDWSKPVPLIETVVPTGPDEGESEVMVGDCVVPLLATTTLKLVCAVCPLAFVTVNTGVYVPDSE